MRQVTVEELDVITNPSDGKLLVIKTEVRAFNIYRFTVGEAKEV